MQNQNGENQNPKPVETLPSSNNIAPTQPVAAVTPAPVQTTPPTGAPPTGGKWRITTWVLGILTALSIIPIIVFQIFWSLQSDSVGMAGLILVPFFLLAFILIPVDFILAIIYVRKRRPTGKGLVLPLTVVVSVGLLVGLMVWGFFSSSSSNPSYTSTQQAGQESQEQPRGQTQEEFYEERTIDKAEAIAKINNCEVKDVNPPTTYLPESKLAYLTMRDSLIGDKYFDEVHLEEVDAAALKARKKCGSIRLSSYLSSPLRYYESITREEAKSLLQECQIRQLNFFENQEELERFYSDKIEKVVLETALDTGVFVQLYGSRIPHEIGIWYDQFEYFSAFLAEVESKCSGFAVVGMP